MELPWTKLMRDFSTKTTPLQTQTIWLLQILHLPTTGLSPKTVKNSHLHSNNDRRSWSQRSFLYFGNLLFLFNSNSRYPFWSCWSNRHHHRQCCKHNYWKTIERWQRIFWIFQYFWWDNFLVCSWKLGCEQFFGWRFRRSWRKVFHIS